MLPPISTSNLRSHSPGSLRIVRFSTHEIVTNALAIQKWFEMKGVAVFHVGFEYQGSWDIVVVDGQCLQALPQTSVDFTVESINPTQPSGRETDVYGFSESTMRSSQRFLWNALDAIFHTKDDRASWYYRAVAKQNLLLARLEVLVFWVEFEVTLSPIFSASSLTVRRSLPLRSKTPSLGTPSSSV